MKPAYILLAQAASYLVVALWGGLGVWRDESQGLSGADVPFRNRALHVGEHPAIRLQPGNVNP